MLEAQLASLGERVGALSEEAPAAAAPEMCAIAAELRRRIGPHAAWEERVLYPAVDRRLPTGGPEPFTASMRHDHRVVERGLAELDARAAASPPDPRGFARSADRLLGVIAAHFEAEEDVLLPVLDRSMTPEQFEREILEAESTPHGDAAR